MFVYIPLLINDKSYSLSGDSSFFCPSSHESTGMGHFVSGKQRKTEVTEVFHAWKGYKSVLNVSPGKSVLRKRITRLDVSAFYEA